MPKKQVQKSAAKQASDIVAKAAVIEAEVKAAKASREAAAWKSKYKDAVELADAQKARIETLLSINKKPKRRAIPKPLKKTGSPTAVIIPANDWHIDEVIDPAKVSYKNRFDLATASSRIRRYYAKAVRLIEWQNHLAQVNEIWHPLLGDLFSGHIHAELAETNSLSPVQACNWLQDMIVSGIEFLHENTGLPVYVPTCVGNHSRTTEKMRIKTSVENSFEWLLYKTVERHFADKSWCRFFVGSGYHNVQEIVGRKVRFHHGDAIRYGGGVGGISIPVNKAIAQWNKAEAVDLDIFGHWHQFMQSYPYWICCGALVGYSEYCVKIKAEFQHPTQLFCVINRRYGVTHAEPIFVSKAKKA